jgi:parallel beta helix pectate lyase-like protein
MRPPLGLLSAAVAASALLVLGPGQAQATNVHCGDVITQDTTLASDLLGCSYPALTITGENVVLDLNQHVVEGGISAPRLLTGSRGNLMVENGTVRNGGVDVESYATVTIRGITTTRVFANEIDQRVLIENNVVGGDGLGGITVGRAPGEVNHNVIRNGGTGLALFKGFEGSATDNLIEENQHGMDMSHSAATLIRNTVRSNSYYGAANGQGGPYTWIRNVISDNGGPGMYLGYGHVLKGNLITRNAGDGIATYGPVSLSEEQDTITGNGQAGIRVTANQGPNGTLKLTDSTVSGNRGDGIALTDFRTAQITGTNADRNGGDGIRVGQPFTSGGSPMPTLSRNHTWFNGNLGIEAVPGVMGGSNWAKHNGNPLQCVPTTLCSTTGKPKG